MADREPAPDVRERKWNAEDTLSALAEMWEQRAAEVCAPNAEREVRECATELRATLAALPARTPDEEYEAARQALDGYGVPTESGGITLSLAGRIRLLWSRTVQESNRRWAAARTEPETRDDMSTERERLIDDTLTKCREAIKSLPADALGEGSSAVTHPDGEAGVMTWPIRDELVDAINRSLASLATPAPEPGNRELVERPFDQHLDVCPRCANEPFNLCPTGAALLHLAAAAASMREPIDAFENRQLPSINRDVAELRNSANPAAALLFNWLNSETQKIRDSCVAPSEAADPRRVDVAWEFYDPDGFELAKATREYLKEVGYAPADDQGEGEAAAHG